MNGNPLRIAIIGAGAMGSLFGAFLAQAADVVLIDPWTEHIRAVAENGLTLERVDGKTETVRLTAVSDPGRVDGPVDLAVIFTKSHATARAAGTARTLLKPDGLALTLQNGLGNLPFIADVVGADRAVAGVTAHGATVIGPGHIRHAGSGKTAVGRPPTRAERIDRMTETFRAAGIETEVSDDVDGLIWGKLIVNVGINALAAILRVENGVLGTTPECEALMDEAVDEAVSVARALGIRLPDGDPRERVRAVCQATAGNRASMLQDILRGRPTEVAVINGAIVEEARALGIEVPVNRVLTRMVQALDATADRRILP